METHYSKVTKTYSIGGYAPSTGGGTVKSVNNKFPDASGNVTVTSAADSILGDGDLLTEDKTLVGAINELFTNGNNIKARTIGALLSKDPSLSLTNESSWDDIFSAILSLKPNEVPRFSDDFNRPNSSVSMGLSWVYLAGVWGISEGKAYRAGQGSNTGKQLSAVVDTGMANAKMQATLSTVSTESRIVFRALDRDNLFQVKASATNYTLRRIDNGVTTTVASYAMTPKNGDVVEVTLNGESILVSVNGNTAFSTSSAIGSTRTMHGIGSYDAITTERYDDFSIEGLV